jgi:hypothetical protein
VRSEILRRGHERTGVRRAIGLRRLGHRCRTAASRKADAYFIHNAPLGRRLRIEHNGCGYFIHAGEHSPTPRDGDLLLVDRRGHVTRIVHQH